MRRNVIRGFAALLLLGTILTAGGYIYFRRSLPQLTGAVAVAGLTAPVDIVRDAHAIPHIFASTRLDALYALGYVHAQDRLWQMEVQRRISHGRLSEVFGAGTLAEDRFLRTVGFGRAARAAWAHLPLPAQDDLNAYVSGVNAFISSHDGSRLPPEFSLLRFEPEPWTGVDVIAWGKMMAWDLSANFAAELLRHDIAARVGTDGLRALMPPYPAGGLTIVRHRTVPAAAPAPAPHSTTSAAQRHSLLAAFRDAFSTPFGRSLAGPREEGVGSNNWVVGGALTASGRPLLANDPHLAPRIPSLWYLAHLKAGDFEVIGATLPGAPAVVIGRNRHIAWGVTNVAADVEDLFLEKLDRAGTHAEFRGGAEPLRVVDETIRVGAGRTVRLPVRFSRHGPLVSDAININNAERRGLKLPPIEPMAFRWTALDDDDQTVAAFLRLNDARNWREFTEALRLLVSPVQNFVYADVEGHIGYYAPGRIPIRASGDGSRPVPGWTGESEWTGYVPFEQLPHVFDPPGQFVVTANHKPMPDDYPYLISLEYPEPYRAQRITDLLQSGSKLTADTFRTIQADTVSLHAKAVLPILLERARPRTASAREALDLLSRWDYDAAGDSAAAAIFQAWFLRLAPALLEDDLGSRVLLDYQGRFSMVTRFLLTTLKSDRSRWCDNRNTPAEESCTEVVSDALHDAIATLRWRLGPDITRWRWDALHRAVFPHQGLSSVPVLGWMLNRSIPNGGDFATVNVAPVATGSLYDQREVPSYRQIVDLSPANDSRFLDPTGQSGHPLSPYYDEALQDWQAVRHRPMQWDREVIEEGAIGRLRLLPKP
jgi:penicillin amidase